MRSLFSSSLDKIDTPAPFVNALNWEAYRSQFRTAQSGKSGNRNCALASGSLNPDSVGLSDIASQAQDIPLFVENTLAHRFRIEIHPELQSLTSLGVDACFGAGNLDFLDEKPAEKSWLELSDAPSEESFDQELSLLESVQEVAMALSRTTPTRSGTGKKAVN